MSRLKIKDVAAHLGVEPQTAGRLLRELGLSTRDTLDRIRLAYIARLRGEASNASQSPERRELLVSRRRLLDLELRKRERKTIDLAEAERLLAGAGVATRTRLEHADRQLRAAFPNLDEAVFATLRRLHGEALALVSEDVLRIGEAE